MSRKIIHIDMDAFFASVEQRDFPELKGKAIAVGGSKDRGVVAAASYEARKFGVRSAMASRIAIKKCPHLIFQAPRFEVYKEVSMQIHAIFREYTDLVEPLSLDEAYLDVTENKKGMQSATLIANEIRERIFKTCQLTASAGISANKFIAKTASDINKPNGFCLIEPEEILGFIAQLPINKFHGIGKVTAKKLNSYGVFFGSDLKKLSLEFLKQNFGKSGVYYFNIARGIDERRVNPDRIRKSIGAENTFEKDLYLFNDLKYKVGKLSSVVANRLEKHGKEARTLTLKIKFSDFSQITRSTTTASVLFQTQEQILSAALELLQGIEIPKSGIRLMGISLSNFDHEQREAVQMTLAF